MASKSVKNAREKVVEEERRYEKANSELREILDTLLAQAVKGDAKDVDPSSPGLLDTKIRTQLSKRLPRTAIQEVMALNYRIDADNNGRVEEQKVGHVGAVIVDYLADKIFGHLLSVLVSEQKVLNEGHFSVKGAKGDQQLFQVIAQSKVTAKVRLSDGTEWVKEGVGVSSYAMPGDGDVSACYRVAISGSVTNARRIAIQQFGPVFGGFDIRDHLDQIQKTLDIQQEAKRLREAEAELKHEEEAKEAGQQPETEKKPGGKALNVDPGLVDNATTGGKAKTVAKVVTREGAAKRSDAKPYLLKNPDGSEKVALADPEIFVLGVVKMIDASKTADEVEAAVAANEGTMNLLASKPSIARLADRITEAKGKRLGSIAKAAEREASKAAKAKPKPAMIAIEDPAGVGSSTVVEIPAGEAGWSLPEVALIPLAEGEGFENLSAFANALVNALNEAPAAEDVKAVLDKYEGELAKVKLATSNYIRNAATRRIQKLEKAAEAAKAA